LRWPAFPVPPSVDPAVLAILAQTPVAVLADALDRSNILAGAIRHVAGPARLCGRALTVLTHPGDNLAVFQALAVAAPGDVLVVSAGADADRGFALVGEFVALEAGRRGLGGFVVDGAVRDADDLAADGVSVFARARHGRGPARSVQGRIGWPVAVGGVAVLTGDIVVGDGDGVAVVPHALAQAVAQAARERLADEAQMRRRLAAGEALGDLLGIVPYPYPPPGA
jgi:regulator of RNase E activity RraA